MTANKGKFKVKGTNILKNTQRPNSMKDFLKDMPARESEQNSPAHDVELHKSADTHLQRSLNTENIEDTRGQGLENGVAHDSKRLHLHIRKDLADRLYETVFKRKRDSIKKGEKRKAATQRAIIEEALEEYFMTHGP